MALAEDYITLDATALADLVRLRHVNPAELVETAIARLEQVEPKLAGMAEWTLDQARQVARHPLGEGPFAGVPFLLKDNMHCAAGILVLLRKNGGPLMQQEDLHGQVTEALYAGLSG